MTRSLRFRLTRAAFFAGYKLADGREWLPDEDRDDIAAAFDEFWASSQVENIHDKAFAAIDRKHESQRERGAR